MQNQQIKESEKIKIDIFVPLDACACEWDKFMDSAFRVMQKYVKFIEFQTKNINSEEGRKLKLSSSSIVVNEIEVFISPRLFKQRLQEIIMEKGFLD